jgi:ADP-ribose pyrophosphatase YjhB (NUDIX family)
MPIGRAAGGLLWREGPGGPRIALVHRPRRDDWSLPKGKLDQGESWEAAALREVQEETGCEARIIGFAGASSYVARRAPKIVLYWHMALVREGRLDAGDEVDEVAWLAPAAAMSRLDYALDRELLARSPPGGVRPAHPPGPGATAVAIERANVLRRVLELGPDADAPGLGPALELLDLADDAAARGGERDAHGLILAARRLALLSADEPERSLQARSLREEARRLAPWRRHAVRKLLPGGERVVPEALYLAAALRDEEDESGRPTWARARIWAALALGGALALLGLAAFHAPGAAVVAGGAAGLAAGAAVALAALGAAGRRGRSR